MKYNFTKMHGCGNDYVYFNCFEKDIPSPEKISVRLSDRHFGIGGDGIILICPSDVADAKMRMFNADGSEGKMCGNGIRCVGKFLYDNNMLKDTGSNQITIETLSGIKTLKVSPEDNVAKLLQVDMGSPVLNSQLIPVNLDKEKIINYPLLISDKEYFVTCLSMGNPHCVVFLDDIDVDDIDIDIEKIGPLFEKNSLFPQGVNTEFVNIIDDHTLKMRVWERGSGETLACGTGACASVVAAILNGYCKKNQDIKVKLKGGDLIISYTDDSVYMTGPAETVFKGEIEI